MKTSPWLWLSGYERAKNVYVQFRKLIDLPKAAQDIQLRICSNEHYRLWINNTWVKDGAARFEKPNPYADVLDNNILKLNPGENCIAIQCVQTGLAQHGCALAPGALFFDLTYKINNKTKHIRANQSWRARIAPQFQGDAPRKFFALQFNEYINADSIDQWTTSKFDDSDWQTGSYVSERPFKGLRDRPIPFMDVTVIKPTRVRRYEVYGSYNGIAGLYWAACAVKIPQKEILVSSHIYCNKDTEAFINFACDNYAHITINNKQVLIQGEPDNGFTNHLESERKSYKGMQHGHGLRHEGPGSRPSSTQQQGIILKKGWNQIKIWIWRPQSCNGFTIALMDAKGKVLPLAFSAEKRRTDTNRWSHNNNFIQTTSPDIRPLLEAAHLADWQSHRLLSKPRSAQALLHGKSFTLNPDHAIDLDFGDNVSGYLELDIQGEDGAVLDICVGEAQKQLNDGALRACYNGMWQADRLFCHGKTVRFFSAQRKAGRYIKFIARNTDKPITLSRLRLHAWSYPAKRQGSFTCNDALMNWMWRAGANTVNASTFDVGEDCPTREQGQWTGDMYLRMHQITWLWGDLRLAAKALRETAADQPRNAWARPICPSGYGDKLVDYCPLLPIMLLEHYAYTADEQLLNDCYRGVTNLFQHAESLRDRYGMVQAGNHQRDLLYIDYSMSPYPRCGETTCHLQGLLYSAYRHAASIADILHKKADARRFREQAQETLKHIHRYLWNPKRGLFADGITKNKHGNTYSAATNYYALYCGICSKEQELAIMDNLWLSPRKENMDYWERGESPFTKFFAARALLERGYWKQALSMWRGYYKNMAKHPEAYSCIEWWQRDMSPKQAIARSSLVHPFSMGSMADFAHIICGLQPAGPGFKHGLAWKPCIGDLKQFDASFPLAETGHWVDVQLRNKQLTLIKPKKLEVFEDLSLLPPQVSIRIKNR